MERKNLESAAANYSCLRGLHAIPLGIVIVLSGVTNMGWGPLPPVWVFSVAVLLAGVAYWRITRFYEENYGRITPSRSTQARVAVGTVLSILVASGGVHLDWNHDLPINATAAAFGLLMLVCYGINVSLRKHHLILCGGLLAAGLLPVWGAVEPDLKINLGLILAGFVIMATGIFDHGVLKRTFGDLDVSNV